MKLDEIGKEHRDYSRQLSSLVRQLGLAGIAFVWVFSGPQEPASISVPDDLTRVAFVLVITLALDFLQYAWGALAWGVLRRSREKRHSTDREADVGDAPDGINWPTNFFFWSKAVGVFVAYVLLGCAMWSRLT